MIFLLFDSFADLGSGDFRSSISTRTSHQQRKRATHLTRDHDRNEKWESSSAIIGGGGDVSAGEDPVTPVDNNGRRPVSLDAPSISLANRSPASRTDSLPLGMTPMPVALRVETTNRFTSLVSSKQVLHSSNDLVTQGPPSGYQTPQKRSSIGGSTDRQTFHKLFSATVKSNQLHSSIWDHHHRPSSRDGSTTPQPQQPQRDDHREEVYQYNMGDLIWLELQAWFAGRTMEEQNRHITKTRLVVKDNIKEILLFRFKYPSEESGGRPRCMRDVSVISDQSLDLSAADVFYDAQESLDLSAGSEGGGNNISRTAEQDINHPDSSDTLVLHNPAASENSILEIDGPSFSKTFSSDSLLAPTNEDLRKSLDVLNRDRLRMMNQALDQVSYLLQKLETAEQYYASGKMFRIDHPTVGNPEFQARVKSLCMWYNLTMQIRSKIDVLGKVLLGLGATKILPWPSWIEDDHICSDESGMTSLSASTNTFQGVPLDSPITPVHSRDPSAPDTSATDQQPQQQAVCNKVRFKLSEEEASSTNPSDSNNSTSTDSGAAAANTGSSSNSTLTPSRKSSGGGVNIPTTSRQTSMMSVTSSSLTDSTMSTTALVSNPYRKYVEKYLKTKGLRKTMAFLQRLVRGPLRRAKTALERPHSSELDRSPPQSLVGGGIYHPHLEERFSSHPVPSDDEQELRTYGTWNPEFLKM